MPELSSYGRRFRRAGLLLFIEDYSAVLNRLRKRPVLWLCPITSACPSSMASTSRR